MKKLTSWGKYPVIESTVNAPLTAQNLSKSEFIGTPRGLGRSYGDSALSEKIIATTHLNHFISFDEEKGVLCCEAGVSLAEILTVFVPKGWFLYVTPGTKFVSVGGAIASDVHGKNHHLEGSFSDYVISLKLMIDSKEVICSKEINTDLFYATCGGMGLTGVIIEATFQLRPVHSAYINQKVIKAENLDTALTLFDQYEDSTYSVAWIDCLSTGKNLGRSLLMFGEHAEHGELSPHKKASLMIPLNMPSFFLNKYSIQAFNFAYYHKQQKNEQTDIVHYDSFFYPLDSINNWNRMYGKSGFTQYQFVIPKSAGKEGLKEILETIAHSKQGSFLAVLKVFGKGNKNMLSFPMEGYTLALDFKINKKVFLLLNKLDDIVNKYNGRLYLTKDVRMSQGMFKESYPEWEEFQKIREKYNANEKYYSLQSKRLGL